MHLLSMRLIKSIFLLLGLFITFQANSENINKVQIGYYYYAKGIFSDDKVKVIEIDRLRNRVKVANERTKEIQWVKASELITVTESIGRDIKRIDTGLKIFKYILKSSNKNKSSDKGFYICNKSNRPVISMALAYWNNKTWRSIGWYLIKQNQCGKVLSYLPVHRKIYYRATAKGAFWSGKFKFCAHPKLPFSLKRAETICHSKYKMLWFDEITVSPRRERFILNFN